MGWTSDRKSGNHPLASPFAFFGWEDSPVRLVVYGGFETDGHGAGTSLVTGVWALSAIEQVILERLLCTGLQNGIGASFMN